MNRQRLANRLSRRTAGDPLLTTLRRLAAERATPLWLVGGCVRDAWLGRPALDLDLICGRATAGFAESLARELGHRAIRFRKRGVTTWRLAVDGRGIDVVDAARRGLARDLERRELTINAIAWDLVAGCLEDPTGGLRDLRARRLRRPRPGVFAEDPVRALRLCRFRAALPDFRLDRETAREAATVERALRRAAVERVRDELDKLLLATSPSLGLATLAELDLLREVLPELLPLARCVAGAERPDVWTHTLATLAASERAGVARLPGHRELTDPDRRRWLRWTLLLHDIAKPDTLAWDGNRPTFHGHENLGARRADGLLRRLGFGRRDRQRVTALIRHHLRPSLLADAGAPPRGMRRLVRESGPDLPLLVLHAGCDALGSGSPDHRTRWRRLRPVLVELLRLAEERQHSPPPVLIRGRDILEALEIEPGPRVGELLRAVADAQEAGRVQTRADALRLLRELTS